MERAVTLWQKKSGWNRARARACCGRGCVKSGFSNCTSAAVRPRHGLPFSRRRFWGCRSWPRVTRIRRGRWPGTCISGCWPGTRPQPVHLALSDARTGCRPFYDVGGATSAVPGPPPITQIAFVAGGAHYPGGPVRVLVGFFPVRAAFSQSQRGRRPHLHFRGLLDLYSRYDLPSRSPA